MSTGHTRFFRFTLHITVEAISRRGDVLLLLQGSPENVMLTGEPIVLLMTRLRSTINMKILSVLTTRSYA